MASPGGIAECCLFLPPNNFCPGLTKHPHLNPHHTTQALLGPTSKSVTCLHFHGTYYSRRYRTTYLKFERYINLAISNHMYQNPILNRFGGMLLCPLSCDPLYGPRGSGGRGGPISSPIIIRIQCQRIQNNRIQC